ncbi:hypothetical protein PG985_000890 [Apiospora marii]|uniref:Uncharacterized protein n=1 Tax=Apiospora marii TaxID=335849 RepID=A0ABR1RIG4_9PEZI
MFPVEKAKTPRTISDVPDTLVIPTTSYLTEGVLLPEGAKGVQFCQGRSSQVRRSLPFSTTVPSGYWDNVWTGA